MTSTGEKIGVEESHDPEPEPLKQHVAPEDVLDRLDAAKEKSPPK